MPIDHNKRIDRIMKLLGIKKDAELAECINAKQPQISRWRSGGLSKSTAQFLDLHWSVISNMKREINRLKKEIKELNKKLKKD